MGILNVTPDSFSDGGQHIDPARAVEVAYQMAADGADLIDIGAESTRPGSKRVSAHEQIARLRPVLERLERERFVIPLTVDTTLGAVAEEALARGVAGINDISAGREDPGLFKIAAAAQAPMILMHMQGTPETMQDSPTYGEVVSEVVAFLLERVRAAEEAGLDRSLIAIDPGIGFGKTMEHNLRLLRQTGEVRERVGKPVLIGVSRKGFLGKITGRTDAKERVHASTAAGAFAAMRGADVLRVHDVGPTRDMLLTLRAISQA